MRRLACAGSVLFLVAMASPAVALQQPGGAPIPSDMGCDSGNPTGLAATFACVCDTPGVCNIGAACPGNQDPASCDDGQNATCETTLWHAWNDDTCVPSNHSGLDPWTDGAVTPETFMPTCPLTFTVLTRGTARFGNAFGWYNVTGTKPTPDQLYVMLDCNAQVGSDVVLDVRSDPRYLGGEIGFFLLTPEDHAQSGQCAGGDCCARLDRLSSTVGHVYYSERNYNPDAMGTQSLIHLVVFDSRIADRKFYFAWEDTFNAANNDFTDLVTSVQGVECSGGGVRCDTGKDGVCGLGLTTCHSGALKCVQLEGETDEQCNGVDDDCDGQVDEDATCPNQQVCDHGRCLPSCEVGSEFACPEYAVCDQTTGRCVRPGLRRGRMRRGQRLSRRRLRDRVRRHRLSARTELPERRVHGPVRQRRVQRRRGLSRGHLLCRLRRLRRHRLHLRPGLRRRRRLRGSVVRQRLSRRNLL